MAVSMLERIRKMREDGAFPSPTQSTPPRKPVAPPAPPPERLVVDGDALQDALKVFGHTGFRDGQEAAIREVMEGSSGVLCVFPTGAGKSLVYQLPSIMSDKLTVVVSPLIALMKDQVDKLQSLGVNAVFINSTVPMEDVRLALGEVASGGVRALYVAPERFNNSDFNRAMERLDVDVLAIDEAHCISRWGNDFRPAYAELGGVIERINPRQVVALTATATEKVRDDICRSLHLEGAKRFVQSVYRPNLLLEVQQKSGNARYDGIAKVALECRKDGNTGIVYVATRKEAEKVSGHLKMRGVDATFYHAGLKPVDRARIQEEWAEKGGVIVATCAFGMGIDKPDVRFVIHSGLSPSIEDWYQAIGRAGRDGKPSRCVTFCDFRDDYRTQMFLIDMTTPSGKDVAGFWEWLSRRATAAANGQTVAELKMTQKVMSEESGFKSVGASISVLKACGRVRVLGRGKYQVRLDVPGEIDTSAIDGSRKDRVGKLNTVANFYRHSGCRFAFVSEYFGDDGLRENCGRCDNCSGG